MPAKEQNLMDLLESKRKPASPGGPVFVVDGALVARVNQIDQEHQQLKDKIADLEAAIARLI